MTITTFQAAKALGQISGWSISNFTMQRVLYLANMVYIGRYDEPLVDEYFEAWDYGPILPKLYHKVKCYASRPVQNIFRSVPDIDKDTEEYKIIKLSFNKFGIMYPPRLIGLTQAEGGGWDRNYKADGLKPFIEPKHIKEEYKLLTSDTD